MMKCGRWFHLVSCGVFGGKEIIEVLKTMKDGGGMKRFFSLRQYNWTYAFDLNITSFHVFIGFLFFFFFYLGVSLVYFNCT